MRFNFFKKCFRISLSWGEHDYSDSISIKEISNKTGLIIREGKRYFCKNFGWHKDEF